MSLVVSELAPRAILLDIEGTTTPITFVHDVLFPYARRHAREYILSHLQDVEVQAALRELQIENAEDRSSGTPVIREASNTALEDTICYFLWLIETDRKSTPLKVIQGRIWEDGYLRGELQSTVYHDVLPALKAWHRRGCPVAIYSSGSVFAQQLLFKHTSEGDVTRFISAYFDTRVGGKKQADSYSKIARNLARSVGEILFVSDTVAELDAARAAGMMTALCVRSSGVPLFEETGHPVIRSFDNFFERPG